MRLECFFAESGANLAYRLILLPIGVVARKQEGAVHVCTLTLAVVSSDHDQVQGISDTRKVVLLDLYTLRVNAYKTEVESINYLEPVDTASARCIIARFCFQHLDHEALAAILDTFFQERLDLVHGVAVRGCRKRELARDRLEVFLEESSALAERPLEERLRTS